MKTQTANTDNLAAVINEAIENNPNVSRKALEQLIALTSVKGYQFINIKGYSSDATNNTEVADQLVNIGVIYSNYKEKDAERKKMGLDVLKIDLSQIPFYRLDTAGLSEIDYAKQVEESLVLAFAEMNQPTAPKANYNVHLSPCLSYNTNTKSITIFAESVRKTTHVKSTEVKVVKSAPKTIAKELITTALDLKSAKLRSFKLSNMGEVKIQGETLEIV